jgi:prophage regulatory protein
MLESVVFSGAVPVFPAGCNMTESDRTVWAILRRKQVEREVGLSRSTIYQRIKDGTFPVPVKLGLRAVGWRTGDIERFLRDPAGYRVEGPPLPEVTNVAPEPQWPGHRTKSVRRGR